MIRFDLNDRDDVMVSSEFPRWADPLRTANCTFRVERASDSENGKRSRKSLKSILPAAKENQISHPNKI